MVTLLASGSAESAALSQVIPEASWFWRLSGDIRSPFTSSLLRIKYQVNTPINTLSSLDRNVPILSSIELGGCAEDANNLGSSFNVDIYDGSTLLVTTA